MKTFSLWRDPWILVEMMGGRRQRLSIRMVLREQAQIADLIAPPMTRLAILRLLLAVSAVDLSVDGDLDGFELYGEPGFLQCVGVPQSSARSPHAIIHLEDGNNAALQAQSRVFAPTDADIAAALVTAYFCDRGGLKARMQGVSISAQKPLHVGAIVAMPCSETLADLLSMNQVKTEGWEPWWHRPVNYGEPFSGDPLQQLLWPWRRLTAYPGIGVAIAAGQKAPPDMVDPWVQGNAKLSMYFGGVDLESAVPLDITGLVLHQATPLACWQTHKPAKMAETTA